MCMWLCRVSSRPDSGLSWDEALDNSLIQQAPAVYVSELPSTTAAAPSQRLQDFRWTSAVKSAPASGMHFNGLYTNRLVYTIALYSFSCYCGIVSVKLRCLQKEMATYRHWSVSLWRDPDDVSHCRILSPDKTEWWLVSATLCGWGRCFVADQLW